ncbi:MAG: hypothetical protein DYG89_43115 [Caldilinea sp. CFX5]|nr:hypothetical protein [Caldilinea sp. CFX5]
MADQSCSMSRSIKILFGLMIVTLVLAACLSPVRTLPTPTPWPTPTVAVQTTFTVQRATLLDEIEFNGEVAPLVWEPLSFRTEGALGAIYKLEGDTVATGDLLADLEMPDLTEALEQAQVALEQAQDNQASHERQQNFALQRAELEVRKAELLLAAARKDNDATAIQLQELEVQLAQLAVAEIEANVDPTLERTVTKAQLTVEALERQIEDRRLRAPFAGAVIAVGIGLEDIRSTGPRPQPHTAIPAYTPLLVVAQTEPLLIVASKDTPRIAELQVGQPVTITHYLARDKPFGGTVSALPSLSSGVGQQPGFQDALQMTIADDHPPLKIGDFVQVRIRLAIHTDTLVLPDAAVRRFAGRTFVIVQDGDREKRIDIKTGLEADGQVEVLEGLPEGAVVIGS